MSYTPNTTFTFSDYTAPSNTFIFGEIVNVELSSNQYYGLESGSTLSITQVITDVTNYYGVDCTFNLNFSIGLNLSSNYGVESGTDLIIFPQIYLKPENYYGYESNSNLTTAPAICGLPIGYILCATENQTVHFTEIVDVAYGENCLFSFIQRVIGDITFNNATFGDPVGGVVKKGYYKPRGIEAYTYYGYNSEISELSTITVISPNSYYGFESGADLTIQPNISLEISNYYGFESALSINTDLYFSFNSAYGVSSNCDLSIRPNESITLSFYYGNESGSNLTAGLVALLKPTIYYGISSSFVFVDTPKPISFDLTTYSCCPEKYTNISDLNFEMDNAEYPSQNFESKNIIKVGVNLMTRPRFSLDFRYGFDAGFRDNTIYIETGCLYGFNSGFSFDADFRHRLCLGNFIPESEFVNIDMFDVLSEDCSVNKAYYGFDSAFKLTTYTIISTDNYYGVISACDLTITAPIVIPPMVANSGYGFESGFNLSTIITFGDLISYYGESAQLIGFEEPKLSGYYGFGSGCKITFKLDVEIVDSGCLPNEYKYLTESGDEDKTKFTPNVIELYPYQHWVNARCIK